VYTWLVVLHLLGLLLFVGAHGVSAWVAFRVRGERDRSIIEALLGLSLSGTRIAYVGLLALVVGGLGAAWDAGLLLAPWVIASYVVLVVVLGVMYSVASPYYMGIRQALEPKPGAGDPIGDADLVARLDSRRPEILATVGGIGLVVLVWLMTAKPG
jgi:uncharacterized membrane protein